MVKLIYFLQPQTVMFLTTKMKNIFVPEQESCVKRANTLLLVLV